MGGYDYIETTENYCNIEPANADDYQDPNLKNSYNLQAKRSEEDFQSTSAFVQHTNGVDNNSGDCSIDEVSNNE